MYSMIQYCKPYVSTVYSRFKVLKKYYSSFCRIVIINHPALCSELQIRCDQRQKVYVSIALSELCYELPAAVRIRAVPHAEREEHPLELVDVQPSCWCFALLSFTKRIFQRESR